ncbi:MAG: hypothetical protein ACTHNQ_19485 [Microbacterium sp.]|uniref:hypothetical protein n=1 Tax=Microbacterium sp. TaxID=51671 RepID=UPI003F810F47
MKVQVRTAEGAAVSSGAATQRVGSALRVVPAFVAESTSKDLGIHTALTARYSLDAGRYVIQSVTNTATRDDVEANYPTVAKLGLQGIVQAAAPHCIFLTLDDESDPRADWLSVADLTTARGRILPPAVASEVVRRGVGEARMDTIELLYGTAALAGLPPARLIQYELGIPHRTASQWIIDARKAGRLVGMNYNAGRPARR